MPLLFASAAAAAGCILLHSVGQRACTTEGGIVGVVAALQRSVSARSVTDAGCYNSPRCAAAAAAAAAVLTDVLGHAPGACRDVLPVLCRDLLR
jgi:hypothetical protein